MDGITGMTGTVNWVGPMMLVWALVWLLVLDLVAEAICRYRAGRSHHRAS